MLNKKAPLFLTFEYPPDKGGVGMYVAMLKEVIVDARVERLPIGKRFYTYFLSVLSGARSASLVVAQGVFPLGTIAFLYFILFRVPYVLVYHGNDFDQARAVVWRRIAMRVITRRARSVIANSEALRSELEAFFGRRVEAVLPCLPSELRSFSGSRTPHPEIQLLSIARLVPRKGIASVLEAIRELKGVSYTICGEGPERARLEQTVSEFGLGDRVRFVVAQTVEEKVALYRGSDLFILPTRLSATDREGFGIVYLEAGYFSLPVIATKTKGVDEAVEDGETGLLVGETVEEIREAIVRLKEDEVLRLTLGHAGRERVLRAFLPEYRTERIKSLFYV
jgi:phosphatidylinositol alpha-1,6-mannosyltransferase